MYGNASECAKSCEAVFAAKGHQVRITEQPMMSDFLLDDRPVILICTSSTGMGDLPDNIMTLYCDLKDEMPDLSSFQYGVLGLGDSSYDLFNGGAKQLNQLFEELGAQCIGEPFYLDALDHRIPEIAAEKWAKDWVKKLS